MEETVLRDVYNVAEVIEAFVVSANTHTNVTAQIEEDCLHGNTLHLCNIKLDVLRGVPPAPNATYQFGDLTRSLVGRTRARSGRVLTVRYSRIDVGGTSPDEMNRRIDTVLATMVRAGVAVNAASEDEHGEWNWYARVERSPLVRACRDPLTGSGTGTRA